MKSAVVAVCVACILSACGGGGGDDAAATSVDGSATETSATGSPPDREVFCKRLTELQSGGVRDIEALRLLYADLLTNAPPEMGDDVAYFVEHSRAVSEAVAAAGAPGDISEEQFASAMAGLDPATQEFVDDLAFAAETGELPSGPAGAVLSYDLQNC